MPVKDKKENKKDDTSSEEEKEEVVTKEVLEPEEEQETPTESESKEEENSTGGASKITSFSQLDSSDSASDSKTESKDETQETPPTEKKYAVEEVKTPETHSDEKEEKETKDDKGQISSDEVKEWLKDVRPDTTKEIEKSRAPNFKIFFVIGLVLALVAIVAGGISYYKSKVSTESKPETEEQKPPPEATTAPVTETKEPDYSQYNVSVLNGSGIAGEAGKAAKLIEDLKFKKVDTGNAGKYDYTTTIVSVKKAIADAVYEKVKEKLSSTYIVEKDEKDLSEDSEFDIVITVGTKKSS